MINVNDPGYHVFWFQNITIASVGPIPKRGLSDGMLSRFWCRHSVSFFIEMLPTIAAMQIPTVLLETLRIKAEQGDADTQYKLGRMFAKGRGVPQNCSEAAKWCRMAAEQGHAEAQVSLGVMFDGGQGVPQDYTQAAYWLRLAAEQGEPNAQFLLGAMYYKGQGVPQDYVRAHMWVDLAASRSEGEAGEGPISARVLFAEQMPPDQLAEAERLAGEWRPKTWAELKTAFENQQQ